MRFVFHIRKTKLKQQKLALAIQGGAAVNGDTVDIVEGYSSPLDGYDGTVIMGIGGGGLPYGSRAIFDDYRGAGKFTVLLDKGYTRKGVGDSFRVAINGFQPTQYLMKTRKPSDRMDKWFDLGDAMTITPKPYERGGPHILLDGASHKYIEWHRLGTAWDWAMKVVAGLRLWTDRPIIYRPRPDHNEYQPVEGTEFSQKRSLKEDFDRSFVVVSHGGNIGFDAAMAGKPHFCLSDSIAKPISETDFHRIEYPYVPTQAVRHQWLCNVFYTQWSFAELQNGRAWADIRERIMNFRRGIYA